MVEPTLVRLRPRWDTRYVSAGRSVLITGADGFVAGGDHGLYVHNTRVLSRYAHRLNGHAPEPSALSNVQQHSWLGYYALEATAVGIDRSRSPTKGTIELRLTRIVGPGLREEIAVTNFSQASASLRLAIEIDTDFADYTEATSNRRQHGRRTREWRARERALAFGYEATHLYDHRDERGTAHLRCGVTLHVTHADSPPSADDRGLAFAIAIAPQQTWHATIEVVADVGGTDCDLDPAIARRLSAEQTEHGRRFLAEAATFETPESGTLGPLVVAALAQARRDLAALRLHDLDASEHAWTPAAGLPAYVALFGRDTLSAAWQAAICTDEMLRGTLPVLARLQGTTVDDWRDEQPGRILHQAESGPLALLNYTPFARYYGSITTPAFYPTAVSELWHWTGDLELVRPLVATALRGLRWLDEYGDRDRDGFYEYETHSDGGLRNQGWKDSGDAIVHADGSLAEPPIATAEAQAFTYIAKFRMAELLWWLGERADARRLYAEAERLQARFNEVFWMDDVGFAAIGLDRDKRVIRSITSSPGICLSTGIFDDEARVRRVAERLLADDLFTGWGVRTLSSRHPAYDPYSYQRGTVWPVEHGPIALGFARYGLHDAVHRLARAQFDSAALFDLLRLPELFGGQPRDEAHPFPAMYAGANWPQAWSASTLFCLVQAMTGLYPYAPLDVLLLDPHLPDWLPELTVRRLRVGAAEVDLRFRRGADGRSDYEVLDVRGRLHVLRQPSPWSLTAGVAERVKDALTSLLPRH